MDNNLFFDFAVDKESKIIHIQREFNTNIPTIWKAWTQPVFLDKWWGPQPWRAETKSINFKEGGSWLYAMVSPEGEKHWSKTTFSSIEDEKYLSQTDAFTDENGNINPNFPQSIIKTTFSSFNNNVKVDMFIKYNTLEELEQTLNMGFQEGMTIDFKQLDALLKQI